MFHKKKFYILKTLKEPSQLFATGASQVFFVSLNTFFLSKELYVPVFASSFLISMIWSFNVRRVAFGSMRDRVSYSLGAACGAVLGLLTGVLATA
jgi:hypothetical protein